MLNVNFHGIRRNVKNKVQNFSDAQIKVREATSNDPWGPSGTLMSEIADLTYNVVAFSEIMQVLWKRLNDHGKNWKHVYKALVLLEYLIKTGSEKVTQQCKENIFAIQTLKDFQYFEEGKDQGVNVREKAKQLVALLKDDERLKNERARALKARERFAQAASHVKQDAVTRQQYGSTDFSQGSFDEDMLSPGAVSLSELEQARPQTAGEEELQLQLALAMSQEEADQAERLKRNDDLRLQMALSESQEEFKKVVVSEPPKASAMDDLLGISLRTKNETPIPAIDPWGMAAASPSNLSATSQPWDASPVLPETNFNSVQNDPWSLTTVENSQNDNLNYTASLSGEHQNDSDFEIPGMKKSFSAEVSGSQQQRSTLTQSSTHLASFLATDSSLINFNSNARTRTLGNPFHATRPSPMTINELRAQNNDNQTFQMSNAMTLPAAPRANPSQNPFL